MEWNQDYTCGTEKGTEINNKNLVDEPISGTIQSTVQLQ